MPDNPQVLYLLINIQECTDRLEQAASFLNKENLSWERLDAITPSHSEFVRPQPKNTWYRKLTDSEIACYLSHRKAWQYALDLGAQYLVILEDDMILDYPLAPVVQGAIQSNISWDVIKLFKTRKRRRIITRLVNGKTPIHLVDTPSLPIATTGLLLDCKILPHLLDVTEHFSRPIDVDLKHYWNFELKAYSTHPPPVSVTEDNESIIGPRQRKLGLRGRIAKIIGNMSCSFSSKSRYFLRSLRAKTIKR